MCGKQMLSVYHQDRSFTIYCRECWLSDKWDPLSYGEGYNFTKPFFQQLLDLQKNIPRSNLFQTNYINSEYCNYGKDFKDCYLLFGGYNNERVYFGNQVFDSRDSMDIAFSENSDGDDLSEVRDTHYSYSSREAENSKFLFFCKHGTRDCYDISFVGFKCELEYENCHSFGGSNAAFGLRNFLSQNIRYSEDCHECQNVLGCNGLRKKNYCIFNKQYSKEEYENLMPKIRENKCAVEFKTTYAPDRKEMVYCEKCYQQEIY